MQNKTSMIAEFVSANTDHAKSVEARYLEALCMFADRSEALHTALGILRACVDDKTHDAVDNDGAAYQSAALAQAIAFADKTLQRNPIN